MRGQVMLQQRQEQRHGKWEAKRLGPGGAPGKEAKAHGYDLLEQLLQWQWQWQWRG